MMILLTLALALQAPDVFLDAVRRGDVAGVRRLLAVVDVNVADADGRTALMEAAGRRNRVLVELLLEAGADARRRDVEGVSALTIAKAQGASEIEALLRAAGARESLEELLHEAIRAGDQDAVVRLIGGGVDLDALDTASYQTPLMTALQERELEILLRLVDAGADASREGTGIETTGENAITMAARQPSPWALRVLLDAGSRPTDRDRALLLGCASQAVVSIALEAGANPNARGSDGETPLACAASAGATDAVIALLQAGANVHAVADDGATALERAERAGHTEVVALLRRAARAR